MGLENAQKKAVIEKFKMHQKDTGSPQVQIAILTERINGLTKHFQVHKKDRHSRHGLLKLVNQRRQMLDYLKKNVKPEYEKLIKKLNIRK